MKTAKDIIKELEEYGLEVKVCDDAIETSLWVRFECLQAFLEIVRMTDKLDNS